MSNQMNREQMIKDRDAYLARLKEEMQERHPEFRNFYNIPENLQAIETPDWKIKQNSRKGLGKTKAILTESELLHLLKRTKIGVAPAEYNQFVGLDKSEIVEMLLTEESLDPPVNDYNNGVDIEDPNVPFGETFVNADYDGLYEGNRTISTKSWILNEAKKVSTSMHSTMWLFFQNHLVTELWAIFNGKFQYKYLKLLHDYCFGNFKELIYKISIDPSMLIYLNGIYNNKEAPDENFGRELQELFCIGKGPNANYTEGDVQAAARVMTGWNIDWNTGDPMFYDWDHETADKQFSSFYGDTLIEGKSGQQGQEELQDMIDMIFENNEVALFIAREVYKYFVYSSIDEWTEENIIAELATTFRDADYNMKPMLEQLLNSEHFFDEVNYGAVIKTPMDLLVGWWRTMDIQFPFDGEEDIHNKMNVHLAMYWTMSDWGMEIGDPPNVAGWPAFYQYPTFDKTWITTSTIVRRISYVDSFLYWGFWSPNHIVTYDIIEYVKSLDTNGDPNDLLSKMEKLFFGIGLTDDVKNSIKSILLSGQGDDSYWTNAWNVYLADETNEVNKNIVQTRLTYAFQRLFNLSEFQLK